MRIDHAVDGQSCTPNMYALDALSCMPSMQMIGSLARCACMCGIGAVGMHLRRRRWGHAVGFRVIGNALIGAWTVTKLD